MLTDTCSRALGIGLMAALLAVVSPVMAQNADTAATDAQNWRDFIHYIQMARPDAALSFGTALVESKVDPRVLYRLSVETPGAFKTLARGENLEGLAETVAAVRALIEEGYRLESRDPERIAKAIELLGGHVRQYAMGADRLKESGEFAVPQLVQRLADPGTSALLRDRIATVLPKLGRGAVRPLSEALVVTDATAREIICQVLGQIGYAHAAPYLRMRLADPEELERVKTAAAASLMAVTGDRNAVATPVANLFYALAAKYYAGDDSIQPDRRFASAHVWYWKEGLGLSPLEVPGEIFLDVYAMRCARSALEADQSFAPAVTLWLQANLRKEADLPAGAVDPTRAADQIGAAAYAKAAGAKYMQDVLARAIAGKETAVVKGAIQALAQTAGASNLVAGPAGSTPLVSALTYPDLRVRLMAGDAMANARPTESYNGSELVLPALIEALRQTGDKSVLLIEPDVNKLNKYKDMIRRAGFAVVDAPTFSAALEAAETASGVDLVVMSTRVEGPAVEEAMGMLRKTARLSLLPVILTADDATMVTAKRLTRADKMVIIAETAGLDPAAMQSVLGRAVALTLGAEAMDEAEATAWALKAAASLRMLGLTRTTVFDLLRAENALIDALADKRDELKVAAARALAVLASGAAQQAVVELAGSDADESVRIAAYLAAAENVRLIGKQLTDAQAQAVVDAVKADPSQAVRDAASELLGSLNLPSEQIKVLIVNTAD